MPTVFWKVGADPLLGVFRWVKTCAECRGINWIIPSQWDWGCPPWWAVHCLVPYRLGLKILDQVRVLRSREKREGKTVPGICGCPSVATVSFPKFLIYKCVFQLILEKHLEWTLVANAVLEPRNKIAMTVKKRSVFWCSFEDGLKAPSHGHLTVWQCHSESDT